MFLLAIAFLLGHCLVHGAAVLPNPWPWGGALCGAIIALIALYLNARSRDSTRLRQCASLLLSLLLGVGWAWGNAAMRLADQLSDSKPQVDVEITGFVASTLTATDDGVRFLLELNSPPQNIPSRVELTWYDTDNRPSPGELWNLRVRLKPPRGFANPGGADFEAQLFRAGIGATGYVRDGDNGSVPNRRVATPTFRYPILRLRAHIAAQLQLALRDVPHLQAMLGIVQGLAVGETSQITSDQWRVFANTGTTHLIAISGSHIGMVALLIAWLSGVVARRIGVQSRRIVIQDVQSVFGMLGALMYAALAGFSVPTQRTLVMLLVYFGARLLRRELQVTQGLSTALIGVLLIDPFAPLSPGFWLSFGAVAVIFLAAGGRVVRGPWHKEYLRLQAVVSIGLLPFLVGAFGSVSLISPLVNLVAIPWFTFVIVPIVLLGSFCLLVRDWLGTVVIHAAAQLLQWSWPFFARASEFPLATWHLPQWPLWVAVFMLIGCIVLIMPGMLLTRMAGLMLCMPAFFWRPEKLPTASFELAMLDVGQGLATMVRTRDHTLVFDAGPSFRSGRDTGQLVVLPFLYARGVHTVDTLMISHGDNDHVGGAASVSKGLQTQRILLGPSVDAKLFSPLPIERCVSGESWTWDEVTFTVLHPSAAIDTAPRRARVTNDTSCVLKIESQFGSLLLTGDIEKQSEALLLNSHALTHVDIVVVPHHGSRTSSTEGFVALTSPRYALMSTGFGNRWGFPKQEVLERWESINATTVNTAVSGAVEMRIDSQGIGAPHAYRVEHRAYWRN